MLWLLGLTPILVIALPQQGFVIGWGDDTSGQATGVPSVTFTNGVIIDPMDRHATGVVMVANQVLSDAVAIAAFGGTSLALKRDGIVVGWGENASGEVLGVKSPWPGKGNGVVQVNGRTLSNIIALAAGTGFGMGLKKEGTIVSWGEKSYPVNFSNVVSIAAGGFSEAYAVLRNGTVVSWNGEKKYSNFGQVTSYPNLSNIVSVAIGQAMHGPRAVALKSDGTVALFHEDRSVYKYETPPQGLSNVVALAAGSGHTLALKQDGTVFGWGGNRGGEATGIPNTNMVNSYSCGPVTIEGEILSNVVSIAANSGYSMALKVDGTVVVWGRINQDSHYPATVPAGLSNVVAIAAGGLHCLAITTNAAVAKHFKR